MTEYHTNWTIDDYLDKVLEYYEMFPEWRIGQTHGNVLWEFRPDLQKIMSDEIDPFYQDVRVPAYVLWLRSVWDTAW